MFAVLTVAGLALAQENLIIDPWAKPPAALDRAGSRSVADGAALPSPLSRLSPLWAEGWSDPPAISPPKPDSAPLERRAAVAQPAHLAAPVAWAEPVAMIVDPWQSGARPAVKQDFAIVDPWLN